MHERFHQEDKPTCIHVHVIPQLLDQGQYVFLSLQPGFPFLLLSLVEGEEMTAFDTLTTANPGNERTKVMNHVH